METWKLLLITVLSAVALGCIIGIVTGKQMVKRSRDGYKSLLSRKERVVYTACMVVGAGLILAGVYLVPGGNGGAGDLPGDMMNGGMTEGEMMDPAAQQAMRPGDDGMADSGDQEIPPEGDGLADTVDAADSDALADDINADSEQEVSDQAEEEAPAAQASAGEANLSGSVTFHGGGAASRTVRIG